jgi:hypothetical protein
MPLSHKHDYSLRCTAHKTRGLVGQQDPFNFLRNNQTSEGHGTSQTTFHQFLTAETRVRYHGSPYKVCGEYVSLWKACLQARQHSSTCNHSTSAPFKSDFPFNMNWYKIKDHLRLQYQGTQSLPTPVINPSVTEHSGSTSPNTSTQNGSDNETLKLTSKPKTYANYIEQNASQHFPFLICARTLFCRPLSSHKLHA